MHDILTFPALSREMTGLLKLSFAGGIAKAYLSRGWPKLFRCLFLSDGMLPNESAIYVYNL